MKVRNQVYIRNIVKNILLKNKSRSKISILAISLTCILFTTLFSVVFGLLKSMEFQTMKSIGTTSHGSFKDLTLEDIDLLSKDPNIKAYSRRTMLGVMEDGKIYAEMSYQDKQGMDWSIYDSMEGRYPEKDNEALVDIQTLKALGYKGEIGEKINISYDITKMSTSEVLGHKKDEFIVVGTYMSSIDSNVQVGQIYVSEDYCKKINIPKKNNEMSVNFSNTWKIKDKLTKVANRNGYKVLDNMDASKESKTLRLGVNFAYFSNGTGIDILEFIIPSIILVVIVILAGYLLINNIFQISIIQDTQMYGLLKTVGMTKKQIKKVVNLQALYLSIPSIITGNILGILLGKNILNKIASVNVMLEDIGVSGRLFIPIICMSAIFSLLTVYISSSKSAKLASKISPVDAVKYQYNIDIKKSKNNKFSLNKLAFRQVFSKKIRFISIVLSISLSALILNSVLSYTGSMDLEKGVSDIIRTDYNFANPKYFRYMYHNSEEEVNREYIETVKKEKGFIGGGGIYHGGEYSFPNIKIIGQKVSPVIFGMDDFLLKKQSYLEGEFNKEKWDTGDYAYIGEDREAGRKSNIQVGDKIEITFNGRTKEVEVLGKIKYGFSNGRRYYSVIYEDGSIEKREGVKELKEEYVYLTPKTYNELTENSSIMSYGFDVEDNKKEEFNKLLDTLEINQDFQYDSRQRQIDSQMEYKKMFEFIGYAVSSILFIIGMLNLVNIISADIIRNKVNLAVFEALGMTKKQVLSYLFKKSLVYSISGIFLSIILGVLVNKFLLKDLINSMAWTSYSMKIYPLLYVNIVNIFVGLLITKVIYNKQAKEILIDRIKNI